MRLPNLKSALNSLPSTVKSLQTQKLSQLKQHQNKIPKKPIGCSFCALQTFHLLEQDSSASHSFLQPEVPKQFFEYLTSRPRELVGNQGFRCAHFIKRCSGTSSFSWHLRLQPDFLASFLCFDPMAEG
jgi:hypothetical protein